MEYKTLNNGIQMPMVGFGVFQISEGACVQAVVDAIDVGYRLIDTAQAYYNEEAVGQGIARSGIDREELFITTKVWVTEYFYEKTRASVMKSMQKLQTDYLDLVLIHQPLSDYYAAYHALEDLYKEGKLRAIGVSNFSAERMADLVAFNKVKPVVNQVETHLFFQQKELNSWMNKLDIQHEAWGPLAQHRLADIVKSPVVCEIADYHKKTPSQIALRYNIQRGIVVIPKSTHKSRMEENIHLFDFSLSDNEMEHLSLLDEAKSLWLEYDDPNIVEMAMS